MKTDKFNFHQIETKRIFVYLAIVFGVKSIHKVGSKLGKAGMVTGIVGLSVFVFIYLSLILILALANL